MGCLDVDQAEHKEANETKLGLQEAATRIAGASPDFLLVHSRSSGLLTAQEEGSTFSRHSMRAAAQRTWSTMQLQYEPLSKAFLNTSSPAYTHKGITCQLDKMPAYMHNSSTAEELSRPQSPPINNSLGTCLPAGGLDHRHMQAASRAGSSQPSQTGGPLLEFQHRKHLQQDPPALPQPACNSPARLQHHGQGQQGSPAICRPAAGCG